MEQLLNVLLWFAICYMGARMLTLWLMNYLTRELRAELDEFSNRLETGKLIPLTVEIDKEQYFCYNSLTKDFVCQGYNLNEIVQKFKLRYPDKSAAIYDGDETAVRILKNQLKDLDQHNILRP